MSYIRVENRKVIKNGRSLSVSIPPMFRDFEEVEKGQTWYFCFSIGGSVMILTKDISLEYLRKEVNELLELIDYKISLGLDKPKGGYY